MSSWTPLRLMFRKQSCIGEYCMLACFPDRHPRPRGRMRNLLPMFAPCRRSLLSLTGAVSSLRYEVATIHLLMHESLTLQLANIRSSDRPPPSSYREGLQ